MTERPPYPIQMMRVLTLLEIVRDMIRTHPRDTARILDACIARIREARMQDPDILATEGDHDVPRRH